MLARLILALCIVASCVSLPHAQTPSDNLAPGAPGKDAHWPSAGKAAVGTSNTLESKVWFTLRDGVLTEVYYPDVTVANVQKLELLIVHAQSERLQTESKDTISKVIPDTDSLSFTQLNVAKSGEYQIEKRYTVDPQRNVVLIRIRFRGHLKQRENDYRLFVYYDPSLGNSGMHDTAFTRDKALLAFDKDKASALLTSFDGISPDEEDGFVRTSNGFLGTSDGLTLMENEKFLGFPPQFKSYSKAENGNVVQVGELPQPAIEREYCCGTYTLALGFGKTTDEAFGAAQASLKKGFDACEAEYKKGWQDYLKTVRKVGPKYQAQFNMAAMVLKAHEDKTYRGAMIASLSTPWGGGASANESDVGGYHLVWSRDLYQVATAFQALGDKASADRALHYLFKVQQKPDGSFPQNSWLDGRPFWGSLQLDEVAYPLILAYQLGRTDSETYVKHVRPAADFIVRHGPWTPQERWEEESGYSPSTIAAEIAGLVSAAEIARRNNDQASAAIYLAAADEWTRNVEQWTATTTGKHGDGNYYLRLTADGNPNDGSPLELNNGAGSFDEREIVDAGFLELVRLGIKRPDDPLIIKSLAVIDKVIKVETPNGASFYRYNHDGYGEMDDGRPWNFDGKYTGRGRLWVLLAGERGEYELARGERVQALRRLDAMLGFANEGLMIPEQVWDKTISPRADLKIGEGTGSATPLAWSMSQFIRLAASLEENRNVAQPGIVAARYTKQTPPPRADVSFLAPDEAELLRMEAGKSFKLAGRVGAGGRAYALLGTERRELKIDKDGRYEIEVEVPKGETQLVVGTVAVSGATSLHRLRVRGLTPEEKAAAEKAIEPSELLARISRAKSLPLSEGGRVTFIYRGPARRVEVVGDFTGWSPRGLVMREIPGTDVKYYTREFPLDARAEYKFIADGEWMLDPLNPRRNDNGVGGENSNFTMPGYRPSPYVNEPKGATVLPENTDGYQLAKLLSEQLLGTVYNAVQIAHSVVTDEVPSRILGGPRKITVQLPRGYENSRQRFPVLYVQDGSDYIRRAQAAVIADKLIEQKRVAPFIIVFIDPADRMKEYWADDRFADFMAKELVPFIDARFRTRPTRAARALLGASLGGVISVWTALRHPEVFARVGGQSSAFQIDDERVVTALSNLAPAARNKNPLRFYFDVGRMESVLDVTRRVHVMLRGKGYAVGYREIEAGHNYTAWRDQLADAYLALWEK